MWGCWVSTQATRFLKPQELKRPQCPSRASSWSEAPGPRIQREPFYTEILLSDAAAHAVLQGWALRLHGGWSLYSTFPVGTCPGPHLLQTPVVGVGLLTTQLQTQMSKHPHLTPGLGAWFGEASHRRLYFNLPDFQLQPPLGLKRPLRASQIHVGMSRSDRLVKSPPFSPPRGRGRLALRQQGPCGPGSTLQG